MRSIFVNGRFLSQPVTGAQRYGHEVLREFDSLLADLGPGRPAVEVLVPATVTQLPRYRHLSVSRVGRLSGQLWEQIELPFYARGGVLFTPCGGAPVLHRRNVITIHDAAVIAAPGGYSLAFRSWYQTINRVLCHTALHVFTVSNFSKADLVQWYGADPRKTTVTYLGSEHALRPEADLRILERHSLIRFRYALLVASSNPNKNIAGAIRALPHLRGSGLQIAMAGHRDAKVFGGHRTSNEDVHDLGYVDDAELRALYENAACFVFPSHYEGFGLPPLEALALGCPAVVANRAALKEIFSSHAFLCDPTDAADIAAKMLEASHSAEESRTRNRQFAGTFRWAECAKTTWEMLTRLATEHAKSPQQRAQHPPER